MRYLSYSVPFLLKNLTGGKPQGWTNDGGKFVCMDDLTASSTMKKVTENDDDDAQVDCLVYSLGVKDDISFEQTMLRFG